MAPGKRAARRAW